MTAPTRGETPASRLLRTQADSRGLDERIRLAIPSLTSGGHLAGALQPDESLPGRAKATLLALDAATPDVIVHGIDMDRTEGFDAVDAAILVLSADRASDDDRNGQLDLARASTTAGRSTGQTHFRFAGPTPWSAALIQGGASHGPGMPGIALPDGIEERMDRIVVVENVPGASVDGVIVVRPQLALRPRNRLFDERTLPDAMATMRILRGRG